jgi:hypothetical protein
LSSHDGLQFPTETHGVVAVSPAALRLEHLLFGPRALPGGGPLNAGLHASADKAVMPLFWNAMFLP